MKTKKLKIERIKSEESSEHACESLALNLPKIEQNSEKNISIQESSCKSKRAVSNDLFSKMTSEKSSEGRIDRKYEKKKKKKKHNYDLGDVEMNTNTTTENIGEVNIDSPDIDMKADNYIFELEKRKKIDITNPSKKKNKKGGSGNINPQEFEDVVSTYPESSIKREVDSNDLGMKKERKKKKREKSLSGPLACVTHDTSQLSEVVKKESSSEKKAKKIKLDESFESKFDAYEEKAKYTSESKQISPLLKNSKIPAIPNSVLDDLLLKFDRIVEEDRQKQVELEAAKSKGLDAKKKEKKPSQASSNDENMEIVERKDSAPNKKKVIELLKETTSIERIQEELNMKTSNDDKQKLKKIKFEMPFDIPIIHKIAHYISVSPTPQQRRKLEEAGVKLKLGKYTKKEDGKIRKNWLQFCKYHGWDSENHTPFLLGSQRSRYGFIPTKKFRKFVQFISHNFEDRLMYNIYIRFTRLFGQNLRSNFTHEDDEIIIEYLNTSMSTKPFADLALLLKRSRIAVLKRYQKLITDQLFDTERISWDKQRTKQLFLAILEVTGVEKFSDLKDRRITGEEWKKISLKMNISFEKLKRVWYMDFYTRVFNPKFHDEFIEIRQELIETLSENYNDWREIDWKILAKQFDSFTSPRLYKMFTDLVRSKVPKEDLKDFKACLEHLKESSSNKPPCRFTFIPEVLREIDD